MKTITGIALAALLALPVAALAASGTMGGNMNGRSMMGGYGMMGSQGYGNMGAGMMGGMMPMMGWGKNGGAMCNAMAGNMGARLSGLKSELKITKAQEPLWHAYAHAARENAHAMLARCNVMMGRNGMRSMNMSERFKLHEQFMLAQVQSMRALDKTMEPLYRSFSRAQKRIAGRMVWSPMGMMHGGMYGHSMYGHNR